VKSGPDVFADALVPSWGCVRPKAGVAHAPALCFFTSLHLSWLGCGLALTLPGILVHPLSRDEGSRQGGDALIPMVIVSRNAKVNRFFTWAESPLRTSIFRVSAMREAARRLRAIHRDA